MRSGYLPKLFCWITLLIAGALAHAQVNVLTQHNDAARTGANLNETILTTSNVAPGSFGKLFSKPLDGQVYAQPLYVSGLNIGGKTRNVVFVATVHDTVYAFDADDPSVVAPLWKRSFINPPTVIVPTTDTQPGGGNFSTDIGIISTPVIDRTSQTMYLVAKTLEGDPAIESSFIERLHAIDLLTGNDKVGNGVVLSGSYPGTGAGTDGTMLHYSNMRQNQRPALLLANGQIYIASASYADHGPYHGWVLSYRAGTLTQTGAYANTPDGTEAGIWMSGQGPTADTNGNVYVITGNGTFSADPTQGNGNDYGDSFIKLTPDLRVADFFTPYDQHILDVNDGDLGSGGALFIPGLNLLVGGGKLGVMYVIDVTRMGHFNPGGPDKIVQRADISNGELHGAPVFWNGPQGATFYFWGGGDAAKAYVYNGTDFSKLATGTDSNGSSVMTGVGPGAMLSLSANGSKAGSGILWGTEPPSYSEGPPTVPGILHAFDATTMKEIWNSRMTPGDDLGQWAKFANFTIAGGKLYCPTFSDTLIVYGLISKSKPPTPSGLTATAGSASVQLSWNPSLGANGYHVKRSTSPTSGFSIIASPASTSFLDTGLSNGTTYYYMVNAYNDFGQSVNTPQVKATPQQVTTYTLEPIADVHDRKDQPTVNQGDFPNLRVSFTGTNERRAYLKFDLSKVQGTIASATLRLYGNHAASSGGSNTTAYGVLDTSWNEMTLDWANQPTMSGLQSTVLITTTMAYYAWDVTPHVTARQAAKSMLVSLGLKMDVTADDGAVNVFNSRENAANHPQLVLVMK